MDKSFLMEYQLLHITIYHLHDSYGQANKPRYIFQSKIDRLENYRLMSTLPVSFCKGLSNLILSEFIFRWSTTNLFRLRFLMEFKLYTLFDWHKELLFIFIQLPLLFWSFSSELCKIESHWNALDIYSKNVFDDKITPLQL